MDGAILLGALGGVATWALAQSRRGGNLTDAAPQSALLVCLGLAASFLGGGFSFGLAGQVYEEGVGQVLALLGFSVGTVLAGFFVAPGLIRFRGCRSVGSVVGRAFGPAARTATGFLAALFCCAVLGAQLRAMGLALSVWLGVDWRWGVAAGCVVIVALAAGGGARALVRAAPVQTALLLAGIGLAVALGLLRAGGPTGLAAKLPAGHLAPLANLAPAELAGLFLLFLTGETLSPPAVQRLLEGRDGGAARRGAVLAGALSALMFLLSGTLGLIARALFPQIEPAQALPWALSAVLPVGLLGLAAAGVTGGLAAAGASYLGAAAANLQADVLGGRSAGRLLTVVLGLMAAAVAILSPGVMGALTLAYRLWAPAVAVPLLLAARGGPQHPGRFWGPATMGLACTAASEFLSNPFGIPSAVFGIMGAGILCLLLPGRPHEHHHTGFTEPL